MIPGAWCQARLTGETIRLTKDLGIPVQATSCDPRKIRPTKLRTRLGRQRFGLRQKADGVSKSPTRDADGANPTWFGPPAAFAAGGLGGKTMREEQTRILAKLPSGGNGNGNGDGTASSPDEPFGMGSNFQIQARAPFEPILDSEEAAALLKIHPKTLQKLARNGTIP